MNTNLEKLQAYPFERLSRLFADSHPNPALSTISLSIGEPSHAPPAIALDALQASLGGVSQYPPTRGTPFLREAIANWLSRRFSLASGLLDADQHLLPVNGTREALFAIAQCLFDQHRSDKPLILIPNPFYQIYEGAALLAGATPFFYNTQAGTDYLPDLESIPASVWAQCQCLYLCTPGNPAGAVMPEAMLQRLINLAEQHDFILISDECYSEIYPLESQPPTGLLQAAAGIGNTTFQRCLVFNSLSKRSNLPGLRSGFVAGDAQLIKHFLLYRTYHGCAMPTYVAAASAAAWQDEQHVIDNRALYRAKFASVVETLNTALPTSHPEGGFFLWIQTPLADTQFALTLRTEQSVSVLPGSFLSRETHSGNPGDRHVRIALVAPLAVCEDAAMRIGQFVEQL